MKKMILTVALAGFLATGTSYGCLYSSKDAVRHASSRKHSTKACCPSEASKADACDKSAKAAACDKSAKAAACDKSAKAATCDKSQQTAKKGCCAKHAEAKVN